MLGLNYRKRALEAEKQLAQATAALIVMNERLAEKAILLSIHRADRKIVFTFARNGEIHRVEAISSWADDIEAWSELLTK